MNHTCPMSFVTTVLTPSIPEVPGPRDLLLPELFLDDECFSGGISDLTGDFLEDSFSSELTCT